MGAKITGPDGKVYGGGYLDPEKQYSLINKQALKKWLKVISLMLKQLLVI